MRECSAQLKTEINIRIIVRLGPKLKLEGKRFGPKPFKISP